MLALSLLLFRYLVDGNVAGVQNAFKFQLTTRSRWRAQDRSFALERKLDVETTDNNNNNGSSR